MTDEDIVRLVLKGKQERFGLLVERYQQKIFGLCYKILGNQQDGEDAAQEVFLKAYQKLGTFNFEAKFSTWLYRVGANTCYDYLRKNKEKTQDVEWEKLEVKAEGPEEKFQQKESLLEIERAVKTLSAEQQTIVTLHLFNGLAYEDIAQVLQITPEAAKMRYYRARIALQKELTTRRGKVGA